MTTYLLETLRKEQLVILMPAKLKFFEPKKGMVQLVRLRVMLLIITSIRLITTRQNRRNLVKVVVGFIDFPPFFLN